MRINYYKIRFRKYGQIYQSLFDIIVVLKSKRAQTGLAEHIGFFNPHDRENILLINTTRLAFWLNRGAILNKSVARVISKHLLCRRVPWDSSTKKIN